MEATHLGVSALIFLWAKPLFGFIIAKLFTDSITADVLTINWACPRLVE